MRTHSTGPAAEIRWGRESASGPGWDARYVEAISDLGVVALAVEEVSARLPAIAAAVDWQTPTALRFHDAATRLVREAGGAVSRIESTVEALKRRRELVAELGWGGF